MSQIHLRKPSHIALNGSMSFSTRQCEKMGVSIHFAGLTVNKWSSVEDLALIIAQGTTPNRRVKLAIAHTHLLGLFQNIDHSQSTPALIMYCSKLKDFYKNKSIKSLFMNTFIEKYQQLENEREEKTLKKQFEQESRKNAYKGSIISAKRLGNTLDKKINKKSRHGNNVSKDIIIYSEIKAIFMYAKKKDELLSILLTLFFRLTIKIIQKMMVNEMMISKLMIIPKLMMPKLKMKKHLWILQVCI